MATFNEIYKEGRQLQAAKQYEEAAAKYLAAAEVEEKTSLALMAATQCYTELGMHMEAIETAKKAVEKEPEDQFPYISLSRAYQRGGFIPEAEYAMAKGNEVAYKQRQGG